MISGRLEREHPSELSSVGCRRADEMEAQAGRGRPRAAARAREHARPAAKSAAQPPQVPAAGRAAAPASPRRPGPRSAPTAPAQRSPAGTRRSRRCRVRPPRRLRRAPGISSVRVPTRAPRADSDLADHELLAVDPPAVHVDFGLDRRAGADVHQRGRPRKRCEARVGADLGADDAARSAPPTACPASRPRWQTSARRSTNHRRQASQQ